MITNTFTAALVTSNTESVCTATATDAAGNEGTGVLTVNMIPPPDSSACERTLPTVSSGTCDIVTGTGLATLIQGDVLVAAGLKKSAELLYDNGEIVCTGCDCGDEPQFETATKLTCTDAVISPGLINGSVATSFSHNGPSSNMEKYQYRDDWNGLLFDDVLGDIYTREWQEVRSVMAGVTSTVDDGHPGMVRNLNRLSEFVGRETIHIDRTPIKNRNGTQLTNGCAYPDIASETPNSSAVWTIADGINAAARNEFLCLSGEGVGSANILQAPIAIASGAGLNYEDIVNTVTRGTRLMWRPRSNTSLYGNTAMVPVFKAAGAKIGLGSHWSISGSANMIRELSCAADWSERWGGVFTDEELVSLATKNTAQIAGFSDVIGEIGIGKTADVAIWSTANNDNLKAIINAENKDVALVIRGGVPLYGEDHLIQALVPSDNCEQIDICGAPKRICTEREFGVTVSRLTINAPFETYGLFACGAWPNERTCLPSRTTADAYTGLASAGDIDGDGIDDATDNCVGVFNPPTPLDLGVQADSDGDGVGDLCDLPDSVAPAEGFYPQ